MSLNLVSQCTKKEGESYLFSCLQEELLVVRQSPQNGIEELALSKIGMFKDRWISGVLLVSKWGCYSGAFADWLLPFKLLWGPEHCWLNSQSWHCQLFANFWKQVYWREAVADWFHRFSEVISNKLCFLVQDFCNLAKEVFAFHLWKNKHINSQSPLLFFLSQTLREYGHCWERLFVGICLYELMLPLNYLTGNYSERKIALTANFL